MNRIPLNQSQPLVLTKRQKLFQKCNHTSYDCAGQALEGYSFCIKHILEDSTAPFKQCAFVYNTNGKQCYYPAPKNERRDIAYCPEHARKALVAKIKSESKGTLSETPERHLLNLSHYVRSEENAKVLSNSSKNLDPFDEIDAFKVNCSCVDILDYASSSESDIEPTLASEALRGTFLDDSDTESLGSVHDDPLNLDDLHVCCGQQLDTCRHAGIYTVEEVVYTAREKLIKLQQLYLDQFKRLQYILREKKRRYLHALKSEKETLCSIYNQPKGTFKEKKIYEKLKALNKYHRRSGVEAILYKKSLERRARFSEGIPQKSPTIPKCIFTEGGVKCGERTLPSAKHCRKHILTDEKQVLFRACGVKNADVECHEPVPVIFDSNCVFHLDLPPIYTLEAMKFTKIMEKSEPSLDIDVVANSQEIDPDDDMAGLMREMSDPASKKSCFNDSVASETSTDTAFSLNAQCSDRDESLAT